MTDSKPVAWAYECHNKYQKRGGYDERIAVDEWREGVSLFEPSGPRYRNIRPLFAEPAQPDPVGYALAMPEVRAMHTVAEYFAKKRKSILADIGSAHSGRGAGASSWMREDDSDFYRDLGKAFDTLDAALAALVQP